MKLYAPEIEEDSGFPPASETNKGRIIFLNKRVWIAVEIAAGVVSWVPLTNDINAYHHVQSTTSTTWTITHSLGSGTPVVQIYDDTHTMVIPDSVDPTDGDEVVVTFNAAMSGSAVVIAGNLSMGVNPADDPLTYSYSQAFTSQSTWVVTHALGYYPIIRVFVGNQEIQPASIIHDTINQATLTFSSAQTGTARAI